MKQNLITIIALCAILTTAAAQTPDTRLPDDGASATETSIAPAEEGLDMTSADEAYDAAPWKNLQIEPQPADPGCLSLLDGQNTMMTILIMVLILVTGIVIGIIILRCGKLFHRVSRIEQHLNIPGDYIKLKVPDEAVTPPAYGHDLWDMVLNFDKLDPEKKEFVMSVLAEKGFIRCPDELETRKEEPDTDPVEPEEREESSESIPGEPIDNNALNGDYQHDITLIRQWIQKVDEAFPYEIAPPTNDTYLRCKHLGPNGEEGKAWVIQSILNGSITSEEDLVCVIKNQLKDDALTITRNQILKDIYGYPVNQSNNV